MTVHYEILHLRYQRGGETGESVPKNMQEVLIYKFRPPTKDDGDALLIRFTGQIVSLADIYYKGALRGEYITPIYMLWITPFPPDGLIANKIKIDFEGNPAEFLDGDGEALLNLLRNKPDYDGEITLVYAFSSDASENEHGKDIIEDWSLLGVLDLANVPHTTDPIKTVYVLQEQKNDDHRQS